MKIKGKIDKLELLRREMPASWMTNYYCNEVMPEILDALLLCIETIKFSSKHGSPRATECLFTLGVSQFEFPIK